MLAVLVYRSCLKEVGQWSKDSAKASQLSVSCRERRLCKAGDFHTAESKNFKKEELHKEKLSEQDEGGFRREKE